MRRTLSLAVLASALLGACDASTEGENYNPPHQAIITPARPVPPGTAPVGTTEYLAAVAPPGPPLTPALLQRGRESYLAFCTSCHGSSGAGDGAVIGRGFPAPPSFHQAQFLEMEPARIVAVVTEGKGRMLPMAERIPPLDRWAIAYYVKALQLSRIPPHMVPNEGRGP
ncbi:c-type cytochrome [Microvirga roseola]|uniref:c-type cytochrome n=1 Tax=Microvirga roseola TaxID=2883126 RepID=UPI001E3C5F3C|nr:cytochrome c [Microvirga roseola]